MRYFFILCTVGVTFFHGGFAALSQTLPGKNHTKVQAKISKDVKMFKDIQKTSKHIQQASKNTKISKDTQRNGNQGHSKKGHAQTSLDQPTSKNIEDNTRWALARLKQIEKTTKKHKKDKGAWNREFSTLYSRDALGYDPLSLIEDQVLRLENKIGTLRKALHQAHTMSHIDLARTNPLVAQTLSTVLAKLHNLEDHLDHANHQIHARASFAPNHPEDENPSSHYPPFTHRANLALPYHPMAIKDTYSKSFR